MFSKNASQVRRYWISSLIIVLASTTLSGPAQTFTVLHSFTSVHYPDPNNTNSDGVLPYGGLILWDNTLYGTAAGGGNGGEGAVFAINTDGTGFTNLHSFTTMHTNSSGGYTNSDGGYPYAQLILLGSTLYGTAAHGGSSGNGTVFAVNTDGTAFTNLHNFTAPATNPSGFFTNGDGVNPSSELILSGDTLYGTAGGGTNGIGTVFGINTNGTTFTSLYSFTASDGIGPNSKLILSGNTLYGTALNGGNWAAPQVGTWGVGTVFAVNTDGTSFRNLHSFTALSGHPQTNDDGANPTGGIILSGRTLYGTAEYGGKGGVGTVFAVNTDGTGFKNLHNFAPTTFYPGPCAYTNSDGAYPQAALTLSGNTLYGTARGGGTAGLGTVFAVNTDGTGFANLYNFTNGCGLADASGGLILSGNTLYGTRIQDGSPDGGTVFGLSFTPKLKIIPSGPSIILSWPTNLAGFDYMGYKLQSTTNLVSPIWTTNSPAPVVVKGQSIVTNPISGSQQFFRLSQ